MSRDKSEPRDRHGEMAKSPTPALDVLLADEATRVLRSLLDRRPELGPEAEAWATAFLAEVDTEAVASDVVSNLQAIPLDDLAARAGRVRGGYVHEVDAAYGLVRETIDPFITDLRRRANLGLAEAAMALTVGIVTGLYRVREPAEGSVLGYAGPDVPEELAGEVLEVAERAGLTLSAETDDHWPGWA